LSFSSKFSILKKLKRKAFQVKILLGENQVERKEAKCHQKMQIMWEHPSSLVFKKFLKISIQVKVDFLNRMTFFAK
jgi:hypothetical protein